MYVCLKLYLQFNISSLLNYSSFSPLPPHTAHKRTRMVSVSNSQDAKEAVAAALLKAGDYLNAKWEMVNDPVQMCMIAYAFNLMGHYAKDASVPQSA